MKKTYLESIRAFCLECMGGSFKLVEYCPSEKCHFYPYRLGKIPCPKPKITPLRAIKFYCLECAGAVDEVKICPLKKCPVYSYRFGTNPKLEGKGCPSNFRKMPTR